MTQSPEDSLGTSQPRASIIDWLLTIPFWILFFVTLLVFEIAQRIAYYLHGQERQQQVARRLNRTLVWLTRHILRTKIEIESHFVPEPERPYLITSNHQSLFDIPILDGIFALQSPRFIAKKELSRWIPSVSFNLRSGGSAIIDRSNAQQAIGQIQNLAERMYEHRFSTVIFPEGTRARNGVMKKFRHAGLATIVQGAPFAHIIPVTLDNCWRIAYFNGLPLITGQTVRIIISAPIDPSEYASLKQMVGDVQQVMLNNLERLRKEPKPHSGQSPIQG